MNWEKYKQLSPEEREEYQYKFGQETTPSFSYITYACVGTSLVLIHIFLLYICTTTTNPDLLKYKDMIATLVVNDSKLILVAMIMASATIVYNGVQQFIYTIRRSRWLKKHNIKLGWKELYK